MNLTDTGVYLKSLLDTCVTLGIILGCDLSEPKEYTKLPFAYLSPTTYESVPLDTISYESRIAYKIRIVHETADLSKAEERIRGIVDDISDQIRANPYGNGVRVELGASFGYDIDAKYRVVELTATFTGVA